MPVSYKLKVIAVGPQESNKEFFFNNCLQINDSYFSTSFKTVGVSLKIAKYTADEDETLTMAFWDINGSKRFNFLYPTFFRGAAGCLLFFDACNYNKDNSLENWINRIRDHTNYIPIILIGTCHEENKDIDIELLRKYMEEFRVDDLFIIKKNDVALCSEIINRLAIKILENIGTKSVIEKLKNQLSKKEEELYNMFINRFDTCPVCQKKNHLTYLNRFYFSKIPDVIKLRKSLLKLLDKLNYYEFDQEKRIFVGIPCCNCYNRYFTN